MKLPENQPLIYEALTKEQFDTEIAKGIRSINEGKVYLADEVAAEMSRDFDV